MQIMAGMGPEEGSSKAIVFADAGVCYLRNWKPFDLLKEKFDPVGFLSEVALLIDHENLHQILHDIGEENACHTLNKVDGFFGHLIEREYCCFLCRGKIEDPPYTMHLLSHWHNDCLEKFRASKEYQVMVSLVKKASFAFGDW